MTPIFEHSFHLKTSLWQGGACGNKITHCVAGDMGLCAFASCLVRRGDVSPAASPSGACGFLRFGRGGWQSTSSAKRESSSISLSRFQVQPSARSIPIGLQFNPSAVFSVNECISFYELRFTILVLGGMGPALPSYYKRFNTRKGEILPCIVTLLIVTR